MNYFLLTYNLRERSVRVDQFQNDFDEAVAHYSMLERRHADDPMIEVVLFGADSEETIPKTHSTLLRRAHCRPLRAGS